MHFHFINHLWVCHFCVFSNLKLQFEKKVLITAKKRLNEEFFCLISCYCVNGYSSLVNLCFYFESRTSFSLLPHKYECLIWFNSWSWLCLPTSVCVCVCVCFHLSYCYIYVGTCLTVTVAKPRNIAKTGANLRQV